MRNTCGWGAAPSRILLGLSSPTEVGLTTLIMAARIGPGLYGDALVGIRILLIEDDVRLGNQLKPEIEKAGFEGRLGDQSPGWARPLLRLETRRCAVDLDASDGSGYALLETIRRDSQVPVLVVSARSLGEDKIRALDLGDDYVTKPFWTNELSARIRAPWRGAICIRPLTQTPMTSAK